MLQAHTFCKIIGAVACLFVATLARAQALVGSNLFPVPSGFYQSANNVPFNTPYGTFFLTNLYLSNPTSSIAPPTGGGSSVWSVNSFFDVFVEITPPSGPVMQGFLTAPCDISIQHLSDLVLIHEYDTEMLQLDIVGGGLPAGMMLRESPSQSSPGHHTIEDLLLSQYFITSDIDLVTELSLDGGETWSSSQGSTELRNVPEPAALTIMIGGLMIIRRRAITMRAC